MVLFALPLGVTAVVAAWSQKAEGKPLLVVVLAVVDALLGMFVPSLGRVLWRRVEGGDDIDLNDVASKLAVDVLGRVRSSPMRRRLYRPAPLRVRFRAAVDVSASRSAVFGVADPNGPGWEEVAAW